MVRLDDADAFEDTEQQDFETAKRTIREAITCCLDQGIDVSLVAAVLIGAGVSWYGRYRGEDAVLGVLSQTIDDIQNGRHRVERWVQ